MPRKVEHPYKFSEEVRTKFLSLVSSGVPVKDAVAAVGIAPSTIDWWCSERLTTKRPEAVQFRDDFAKAKAMARIRAVGLIQKAAIKDWKAASWFLSRSDPENWGDKSHVIVERRVRHEMTSALDKLQKGLSPEEFERVLVLLAADGAGEEQTAVGDEVEED